MARHKGKIESGIGYVKGNALKGRVFASLEEQNRFLLNWETTVADVRIHGTIRRQVGQLFAEVERPALRPLPLERLQFWRPSRTDLPAPHAIRNSGPRTSRPKCSGDGSR